MFRPSSSPGPTRRRRRLGASPTSASRSSASASTRRAGSIFDQALRALAARGITRVFSEGGPRVAGRLIALKLADTVALITAEKPLGRPGVPALSEEARAALLDGSRYRPHETLAYGPDTMRIWERTEYRRRRDDLLDPLPSQRRLHGQQFALRASEV